MERLAQDRQQDLVVEAVKALRNVALDEPGGPQPRLLKLPERMMAPASSAEAIRPLGELRLEVRLQDEADHLLQQLVRPGRDAERAYLPVLLGNVRPSDWRPPIPLE